MFTELSLCSRCDIAASIAQLGFQMVTVLWMVVDGRGFEVKVLRTSQESIWLLDRVDGMCFRLELVRFNYYFVNGLIFESCLSTNCCPISLEG